MNQRWIVGMLAFGAAIALQAVACSDPAPDTAGDGILTAQGPGENNCATPHDGCPCDEVGKLVECGKIRIQVGEEIQCTIGERVCLPSSAWSGCTGDNGTRTVEAASTIRTAALADAPTICAKDACDPYCKQLSDTPVGVLVTPDAGLKLVDGGMTLNATGVFTLSSCTGLVITPKTSSEMVLTTVTPTAADKLEFTAALTPSNCYPGAVSPIWTIDDARSDALTITSSGTTGTLTAISAIAGPVTVKAHVGSLVGTASALVNVNVGTVDTGFAASATLLDVGTTGAAESNSMLYPYDG